MIRIRLLTKHSKGTLTALAEQPKIKTLVGIDTKQQTLPTIPTITLLYL
jgi:hypothetical protein